jgi:hypothetical protein
MEAFEHRVIVDRVSALGCEARRATSCKCESFQGMKVAQSQRMLQLCFAKVTPDDLHALKGMIVLE